MNLKQVSISGTSHGNICFSPLKMQHCKVTLLLCIPVSHLGGNYLVLPSAPLPRCEGRTVRTIIPAFTSQLEVFLSLFCPGQRATWWRWRANGESGSVCCSDAGENKARIITLDGELLQTRTNVKWCVHSKAEIVGAMLLSNPNKMMNPVFRASSMVISWLSFPDVCVFLPSHGAWGWYFLLFTGGTEQTLEV